jgi:outer membrane protein assembly factor BamB
MKKILSIALIGILFLSEVSVSVISIGITSQQPSIKFENNSQFIINYNDTSKVLIEIDINGISYGHELLWRANTTGTNYEESAVVYFDGIAYISSCSTHGNGHDKIFAVDTTNGDILWSTYIGPGYVGPVIDNDRIYIGTSSHGYDPTNEYVYCINRSDGTVVWSRRIYGGIPESIQYDEDKIYFTSNIIYALRKDDGSTNWTYQMDAFSVTKPLLKDNAFFTATSGGTMYKVDTTDGSRIWEVSLSDFSWDNSITADGKGHIFLALYADRTINSYNEYTGELLWSYRLHDRSLSFNAYHNNVLFISDMSGYVYALNSSTGALLWEKKIGNVFDISSPSISGGLIFIGTRDFDEGAFFALNETNGDVLWKYTIGSSITAPPSIADGMMFCGTDDWHMYAFDFGIGSGDWLLHRYDSSNTAYSSDGLLERQFVSASCKTVNNTTTCEVTNTYDHDVTNVKLKLSDNSNAYWYDSSGNLLKSESDYYMIDNMTSLSSLTFIIANNPVHHPGKPTITGPNSGTIGIEYTYMVSAVDPDDDDISYYIDWGDDSFTGWTRTLPSGELLNVSHTWNEKDTYIIKAKAKDTEGHESEWSDPLPVTMPKIKYQMYIELIKERHPLLFNILSSFYKYINLFLS